MNANLAPGKLRNADPADDLADFLERDADGVSEHVHVRFPSDWKRAALYRSLDRNGGSWVRTDVDAYLSTYSTDRGERLKGLFLTDGEADNLLTLLDLYRRERPEADLRFAYWGENNSPMIRDSNMDNETLFVRCNTESGRSNEVQIDGLYKTGLHRFGKF